MTLSLFGYIESKEKITIDADGTVILEVATAAMFRHGSERLRARECVEISVSRIQ